MSNKWDLEGSGLEGEQSVGLADVEEGGDGVLQWSSRQVGVKRVRWSTGCLTGVK